MTHARKGKVQWNLSIEDTIGTQLAVPYTVELSIEDTFGTQLAVLHREVSLIHRQICTQLYVVGTADSALIREVSLTQSVPYREVPLYCYTCLCKLV